MKKPNSTKVIASVLASSILANSCTIDYYFIDDDDKKTFAENKSTGESYLSLEIFLENSSREYLYKVSTLVKNLTENPVLFQEFVANPKAFFMKNGIESEFNIENSEFKFLFALHDEQLKHAIQTSNHKLFLQICKEKGLFDSIEISPILKSIKEKLNNDPKYAQLLKDLNVEDTGEKAVLVFAFAAVVVAAVYVIAAYSVGLGINWAAGIVAYLKVMVTGPESNIDRNKLFEQQPVLRLWLLKEGNKPEYIVDEFISENAIQIVTAICESGIAVDINQQQLVQIVQTALQQKHIN